MTVDYWAIEESAAFKSPLEMERSLVVPFRRGGRLCAMWFVFSLDQEDEAHATASVCSAFVVEGSSEAAPCPLRIDFELDLTDVQEPELEVEEYLECLSALPEESGTEDVLALVGRGAIKEMVSLYRQVMECCECALQRDDDFELKHRHSRQSVWS